MPVFRLTFSNPLFFNAYPKVFISFFFGQAPFKNVPTDKTDSHYIAEILLKVA
jgi:hypothetical protein